MNPTLLLLQDELPAVQAAAGDRESSEDPVADVRRARAWPFTVVVSLMLRM
jgi:hypothetical protein